MQGLLNLFDLYGERFLVVGVSLLSLTFVTLMFLWSYNRRRFMSYKHHIPARVMQGYLDSVIQNSSALKSSLLRGGGADSIQLPQDGLFRADSSISSTNPSDLAQKNAELSTLKSQMSEKDSMISDLEEKMADLLGKLREAEDNMGNAQKNTAPSDEATLVQLSEITKERDLLKDKLKEYEFIESDLAEIPRLQRTVETYKATLKQLGVDPEEVMKNPSKVATTAAPAPTTSAPAASAPVAAAAESAAPEVNTSPATEPSVASETPVATNTETKKGDDDLLQQFEKMLG